MVLQERIVWTSMWNILICIIRFHFHGLALPQNWFFCSVTRIRSSNLQLIIMFHVLFTCSSVFRLTMNCVLCLQKLTSLSVVETDLCVTVQNIHIVFFYVVLPLEFVQESFLCFSYWRQHVAFLAVIFQTSASESWLKKKKRTVTFKVIFFP